MTRFTMNTLLGFLILAAAVPAFAQRAEFARVREGSAVVLILGTGGECRGKVARRTAGALAVELTAANPDCGARGARVTVRQVNTESVERIPASSSKATTAKKGAAVAAAVGTGLLVGFVPGRAALGVIAGGAEAFHFINRGFDREPKDAYAIYVSHLEE